MLYTGSKRFENAGTGSADNEHGSEHTISAYLRWKIRIFLLIFFTLVEILCMSRIWYSKFESYISKNNSRFHITPL
jgi:hypothetical protein